MSRWYRAYEGTVTDPKFGEVAMVAGCSRSVAIAVWHSILESCAETDDGGRFKTTPRRISVLLSEPPEAIEMVFAALHNCELLWGDPAKVSIWSDISSRISTRPPMLEWRRLKEIVFKRDDFTCQYCGARGGKLQCDHVFPASRGGSHDLSNLVAACGPCNMSKGDKLLEEWKGPRL